MDIKRSQQISSALFTFFSLAALTMIAMSFQNCGVVRPSASSNLSSLAGFDHSFILSSGQSCSVCHEKDRPAPVNNMAHGGGADCIGCHVPTSWLNTSTTPHSPVPTQCAVCHGPTGPYNRFPNDHIPTNGSDCIDCHQASVQSGFSSWQGGVGMPHPASGPTAGSTLNCASCHDQNGVANNRLSVPVAQHYNQATTCVGCHSDYSNFTNQLRFSHPSTALGDCTSCHSFASGSYSSYTQVARFNTTNSFSISSSTGVTGTFDGDSFTSTHSTPALQQCYHCHSYTAPTSATSNVWRFVHRASRLDRTAARNTQACNICHEHQ